MSVLHLIPDREHIEESLELCSRYGACFEYNDFFAPAVLDDTQKVKELIAFYKGLGRDLSRDTLHGVFLDITVHSEDSLIRQVSEKRVRQSMDIAQELGIRGVIFHTNTIPNFRVDYYRKQWLESNEAFFRKLLQEYPQQVFMENMFDEEPDALALLAQRMSDEERFGVCLDYAHACAFGHDTDDWVSKLLPYTKHMHINDNDLCADLHQVIGSGKIDWNRFTAYLKAAGTDCSVLVEVKKLESQRESLEYMQNNKIYPFK